MDIAFLSCESQHVARFRQGYAEVRKYQWSRQIETTMASYDGLIALNWALTPRPAQTLTVSDQAKTLNAGRLILTPPGARLHLSAPPGQVRSLHCALRVMVVEDILGARVDWQNLIESGFLSASFGEIEWLLGRIHREFHEPRLGWDRAVESYANALCVELARVIKRAEHPRQRIKKGGLAPWRMKRLRDRGHADLPAPSQEELASLCAMTVRHLSRAFKEETGITLGRFVTEATMGRAVSLLSETDIPIAHIARALGYACTASFANAFRRATGRPPGAIRTASMRN